ncbi:hypothetical protein H0S70_01635 [Chryseobacterium manosquense]|uniref:Uncharacterized protein n=1 Tax=Chryseobacterium manosquense TaxID=2754694 RepID=A0A7H1DXL4_9FLAO|nr:hypothetical protein [Chryseobacterium manosquense]QNS41722.1 hypothetical protein H0S70_01635 [Chryseobacterium manosquense]
MKTIKTLTIGLLSIFVTAISCREEMISTNETQEITTLIQAGTTTAVAVSMYGIAKKNGAWHGVKLNAK